MSELKWAWLLVLPSLLCAQSGSFTLGSTTMAVGGAAGAASVELIASFPAATWTATSNASWLHLAANGTAGTGGALIPFSYDANPGPGAQSGSLTIAGQTLTITQAGSGFVPISSLTPLISQVLNLPYAVAVDIAGNLYIADTGHNAIQEWNAATQQLTTLVSAGLNAPHGVAVDSQGNVYIADAYNNAIKEWSPATQLVTTLVSSGLNFPVGVAVDGQGNVYIADYGNNAIKQWNAATQLVSTLVGSGLASPTGVAVDGLGNVYIADFRNSAIKQWNPNTQQVTTLASQGLSLANAVAADGQGNIYVVDGNHNALKEWSAATQLVTTLASSGVNGSFGVATDGQGSFFIANTITGGILKLSTGYFGFGLVNLNESPQSGTDVAPMRMIGANIPLSAVSDASWLTITSVSSAGVSFAFQANPSISSRVAHITVLGQQVIVTQSGDVSATIIKSAGDGQSALAGQVFSMPLQVIVTDAGGAPVQGAAVTFTATPGASGASGTFSATPPMPILTDQNGQATAPALTSNAIAGVFTVTAGVNALTATFTLTNLGSALGSASALVGGAAGNGVVLLIAGGSWTAASNTPWLHVPAGSAGGVGNAPIQFSYDANTSAAAQIGTLTIAGLTFTVTQAGASYVPVTAVTTLVSSGLNSPQGVTVDAQGNVYIADTANSAIKEWSFSTQQVTTLVSSELNQPAGVAVDAFGNIYIADTGSNSIKEWIAANPQVNTLVSGLSEPSGVAVDGQGNVYFSDTGMNFIQQWNNLSQQTSTLVSSGLSSPTGVSVDTLGDVYFADTGSNAVKEWSVATWQVTTVAASLLSGPTGVAADGQGNLYFADTGNNAIKQWNAGTQQVMTLLSVGLNAPAGTAVDAQGNVYVADQGNNVIRKLTLGYLALSAGSLSEGASAGTDSVTALVLPATLPWMAVSDQVWLTITGVSAGGIIGVSFLANNSITSRTAHITVLGQQVTVTQGGDTVATLSKCGGDGQVAPAGQTFPAPLCALVTDTGGLPLPGVGVTFSVAPGPGGAAGTFSGAPPMPVLTGPGGQALAPALTANAIAGQFTVTAAVNALTATYTETNASYALGTSSALVGGAAGSGTVLLISNGPWTAASNASWLHVPAGSASGSGSALVEFSYDANSNSGPRTGILTISGLIFTVTQAGSGYALAAAITTLVSSGLNGPRGLAVDASGNVYIADTANGAVKRWSISTQQVTPLVSSGLSGPSAVAVDGAGNVYIADSGNNAIEQWNAATQQVTALVSGLSNPSGVAIDGQGNVYFSDTGNNAIREWNAASRQVSTLVASGVANPTGVAVDGQGNVYVADTGNQTVDVWSAAAQRLAVLVSGNLSRPSGVAADGQGNVDIVDAGDNAIQQWNAASQQVTTLAFQGLSNPSGVALDTQGNVYVADTNNNAIRKLTIAYVSLSATNLNEGAQAGADSVSAQTLPAGTPLSAASDQSWLTIAGVAGGVVSFQFQANTSVATRTAHITVLGAQVTVTQSGDTGATLAKCAGDSQSTPVGQPFATALCVAVTDAGGIPVQGAAVTFSVTPGGGGASGTLGASPPMPILTGQDGHAVAPVLTANGIGGTFTVTASLNALSATFTLTNLVYTLGASSLLVGNTSGTGCVLLVAGGPWTAGSNAPWLQLSAGSVSGAGNALIQFSYPANPNTLAQTAILTISGLTFTVTQAGSSFTPINLLTSIVSSGLKTPQGVAVDGQGNIYIADSGNNAIKEWNAGTQQVTTLVSSGLNAPSGVAVNAQGIVSIADFGNSAIKQWNPASQQVTALVSSGLSYPYGVAVESNGNLVFSDAGHNAIRMWSPSTQQVTTLINTGLNLPRGVAVDALGNVYLADSKNNAVKEWIAASKQVSTLVSSGLSGPYGVAVDGDGNVNIADTGNSAIKQWSPLSQQVTTRLSSGLKSPDGVAVDGQGNVYIADTSANALRKLVSVYLFLAPGRNEGPLAGTDSIAFQILPANTPITAVSNQAWLTITAESGGAVSFSFQANLSVNSRTAQITVLGQPVTITQSGDIPATITKTAGAAQSAPMGSAFPNALQVLIRDAAGKPVQGAAVTFTVVPGSKGAAGTFNSSPPMPIPTTGGYATAPSLTANATEGSFSVTAATGALTATFSETVTKP